MNSFDPLVDVQVKILQAARAVEVGDSKDVILNFLAAALDQVAAQLVRVEEKK